MKMKVDVMVNTYNSGRVLDRCLASIRANIPVRELFVVDRFSEDCTVEVARRYGAIIVQDDGGIAEARALGFKLVETDLFVNVDSDIVLPKDWFRRMMHYWGDARVGCIWGIPLQVGTLYYKYQTAFYRIRDPCRLHVPYIPNMIARRSLLCDIKFPTSILQGSVANEDYYIMDWIEKKGYICKAVPIYCEHYIWPPQLGCKTFWGGASMRVNGRRGLGRMALRSAMGLPDGLLTALISRDARLIPYRIQFCFEQLYGYLHPQKFYDLKRLPD